MKTLNGSLELFSNFRKGVGCFFPRIDWSIGSSVLMVDDRLLDLTMHRSVLPRQIPLLKNDVCDESRFPRFSAAEVSVGSRNSRGKAVTLRSTESQSAESIAASN